MENRFNNRDFEQFVKQNADQYRMFPSEKVWNVIHNTLHTRRRWYGIGLGLLILSTGVVTWVMLSNSTRNKQVVSTLPKTTFVQQSAEQQKQYPKAVITPAITQNNKPSFITSIDNLQKNLFIDNSVTEEEISTGDESSAIAYTEPSVILIKENTPQTEPAVKSTPAPAKHIVYNKPVAVKSVTAEHNNNITLVTDNSENIETTVPTASDEKLLAKNDIYPYSIESVVNSYTHIKKRRKTSLQVYITPTISYRELKENKPFIDYARNTFSGAPSSTTYYSDINSVVTHKPDIGLQLGFNMGYPLSKNLKLVGGLQFNVSKYDIRAYTHPSEVTTIALTNGAGGTNTVSTMTNYRNTGGYIANWLRNLYISASAPIGLELKLLGNRKTYMGVTGTVQPTYILSNRAYLLSTDYKNYAEIPSLTRKWNINTGFEVFAGYSTGKLNWRVGPQVRYQAMSSYKKNYPVQEHLFDFGLKLGLMLNK
ncbi:MAG: hypothetical protein V9F01_08985 [Chitinophagaceae bacterium]